MIVVLRNVQHGIAVLMTEDGGAARELVKQKELIRKIEKQLERAHLMRLRAGATETIETSAIHLDLLRALKMLNTAFATIAYPLLKRKWRTSGKQAFERRCAFVSIDLQLQRATLGLSLKVHDCLKHAMRCLQISG